MRCYKVIKKRFVASILCILTLFAIPLQSYAYSDYSETFIGQPIDGTTRWVSPLKSGTNYYYATITSKWNEQRTVGTTPHVGIDLSISQTKTVVAVTSGTLRKDTSTKGSKYNNVTLDTGHPTKKVYCHYEHCSLLQADGYYNQGDKVATGGKYAVISGTSMATPHATALVALFATLYGEEYDVSIVESEIKENTYDFGDVGKDDLYGYGVPSLALAIDEYELIAQEIIGAWKKLKQ